MDWGFLSEFWDSISGATIEAWEYTTEFFQNIGLAVAGAIGGLFDYLIHYISDLFVFMGYLFSGVKELISALLIPINYIIDFVKSFILHAILPPAEVENTIEVATSTREVFEAIPLWSEMIGIIGVGLVIIAGVGILMLILKL